MQNNLKNSLRFIHHKSMQKVIYCNVKKEKGISPDVDSFSHTTKGFLQGHAQRTKPTKETLSNRSCRLNLNTETIQQLTFLTTV